MKTNKAYYTLLLAWVALLYQNAWGQTKPIDSPSNLPENKFFATLRQSTEKERRWGKIGYEGAPWVQPIEQAFMPKNALTGRHLYVAPSHGRYFNGKKWTWQRPYLFCTVEDLLSTSFVVPYLIPMLENAGAVVYTPRERDSSPFETIVDNDPISPHQANNYGNYREEQKAHLVWQIGESKGFAVPQHTLTDQDQPFRSGTTRRVKTTSKPEEMAYAQWLPKIAHAGRYAVYVSYGREEKAVSDARYIVRHAGSESHFRVNQRMGAGTWVYLGTFFFDETGNDRNCVMLTNYSTERGVVSADAIKIGGGLGWAARYAPATPDFHTDSLTPRGLTSGLPRYYEGARYYAQTAGLPDSLFSPHRGTDDYKDDINARSHLLNYLAGTSPYLPDTIGLGVPFELAFSLHTDAGYHPQRGLYGSLGIVTTQGQDSTFWFKNKKSRESSLDYAEILLRGLQNDLSKSLGLNWPLRGLEDKNYGETRQPEVPSMILELLSHQNFADMKLAHDPNFKFVAARSVYKSMLRYVALMHNQPKHLVVQPLPISHFSALLHKNKNAITLSWREVQDPTEETARADDYIVYTATGKNDWDQGRSSKGRTHLTLNLQPGLLYRFKVIAVNKGGKSFPSETLTAYCSPRHENSQEKNMLLVNAFERLSGPTIVESQDSLGFDLTDDLGVPYETTTAFVGTQINYQSQAAGKEGPQGLGHSDNSWEGHRIAGNRFDGTFTHGQAIIESGEAPSFGSVSKAAFAEMPQHHINNFSLIDYICGLEKSTKYQLRNYKTFPTAIQERLSLYKKHGGHLFVSGSYLGSDMTSETEKNFLRSCFRLTYAGTIHHSGGASCFGLNSNIRIHTQHNAQHFACTKSDVLEAMDGAFSAFSYGKNGYSAGVAFGGQKTNQGRTLVLAFPFECIVSPTTRSQSMGAILRFLLGSSQAMKK